MRRRTLWLALICVLLSVGGLLSLLGHAARATPAHPPPSAAEESATIVDDPTIAPDAAQSADHSVSFPADI
ncbi:MAG: hypothetical protein JOZ12_13455 [Sinobacteraceae bacterium]|nr:hypothetical protein [Nevskiaceae bacterium]